MPWVCAITATTNMEGAEQQPNALMLAKDSSTLKVSAKIAISTTTTSSKGGKRKPLKKNRLNQKKWKPFDFKLRKL